MKKTKFENSKTNLPKSTRVSNKIIEYYKKFGHERDLEKFMRFYSPVSSSQCSNEADDPSGHPVIENEFVNQTAPVKTTLEFSMQTSFTSSSSGYTICSSRSLPNLKVKYEEHRQLIGNNYVMVKEQTTESTPPKEAQNASKICNQTPESASKSHKRLEWDALGDVGYEKSASHINLNSMERSLLKNLFQTSELNADYQNETGNPYSRLVSVKVKPNITLPLASSTLTDIECNKQAPSTLGNNKTKEIPLQQATSQSDAKSIEVDLSCITSDEREVVTPSSFEFISNSAKSTSRSTKSLQQNSPRSEILPKPEHHNDQLAVLNNLLIECEKLQQKRIHKPPCIRKLQSLRAQLEHIVEYNKENKSHKTFPPPPCMEASLNFDLDIDLSIDIICSLIKAKDLNAHQKKKLIRNIVKRIARLCGGDDRGEIPSHKPKSNELSLKGNVDKSTSISGEAFADLLNRYESKETVGCASSLRTIPRGDLILPSESNHGKPLGKPSKTLVDSSTSTIESEKLIKVEVYTPADHRKFIRIPINARNNGGSNNSDEPNSNGNIPNTSTQHFNSAISDASQNAEELNSKSADEHPTMYEWLNPMTQSEFEYESKQKGNSKQQQDSTSVPYTQGMQYSNESITECLRQEQLEWIENEIQRLQCLKYLLLDNNARHINPENRRSSTSKLNSNKSPATYDTVNEEKASEESQGLINDNRSRESSSCDIVLIDEEQYENIRRYCKKLKESTNQNKKSQLPDDKSSANTLNKETINSKPEYRNSSTETNSKSNEQLDNGDPDIKHKQRDKIDTPSFSTDSESSNDIRKMVQQRKKEFLESYQNKKRLHYEALKLQQKKHLLTNFSKDILNKIDANNQPQYSVPITQPYISPSHSPLSARMVYSSSATTNRQMKIIQQNSARTTTSTSSASIFCLTSKISMPVTSGGYASSSLSSCSTPTQQYDDVTLDNIAVQTTASILKSRPIYTPHFDVIHEEQSNHVITEESSSCFFSETTSVQFKSAAVQVKPKGIAYVIEFINCTPTSSVNGHEIHSAKSLVCIPNQMKADLKVENKLKEREAQFEEQSDQEEYQEEDLEEDQEEFKKPSLTLQEHLEMSKPEFVRNTRQRSAILSEMQAMRQERHEQLRKIIDSTNVNKLEKRLKQLPPPPTQRIRVLNSKEMKALTKKRVSNLPEVVAKQQREDEEKLRRNNRILRDLFNKRLQQRVRTGKLSLNHSRNII